MIMKSLELKIPELQELLEKLEDIKAKLQAENKIVKQSEQWLDNDQAVCILRVSKRTLQNYRDHRTIPFSQFGRKILYKSSDLQAFLEAHHIKTNSEKGGLS